MTDCMIPRDCAEIWRVRIVLDIKFVREHLDEVRQMLKNRCNPLNLDDFTELEQARRDEIVEAAEISIKYNGYIAREEAIAKKLSRLEHVKIRGKFKYSDIHSLSTEARQKLEKIDPETVGQASRIPGISPSDVNILLLLLGR